MFLRRFESRTSRFRTWKYLSFNFHPSTWKITFCFLSPFNLFNASQGWSRPQIEFVYVGELHFLTRPNNRGCIGTVCICWRRHWRTKLATFGVERNRYQWYECVFADVMEWEFQSFILMALQTFSLAFLIRHRRNFSPRRLPDLIHYVQERKVSLVRRRRRRRRRSSQSRKLIHHQRWFRVMSRLRWLNAKRSGNPVIPASTGFRR